MKTNFDYSLVASPDDKTKTRFITQGMIAQRTQTGAHSRILHYNGFLWSDGNPRVVVRTDAREKFVPLSGKETNSVPSSFWTKAEVEAVWGETPTVRITELAFGFGESEEDSAPVLEGSAELLWQRENATLVLTSEIQGGAWSTQEVQGLLAYAKHLATDKNTPINQNQEATGATQHRDKSAPERSRCLGEIFTRGFIVWRHSCPPHTRKPTQPRKPTARPKPKPTAGRR